MYRINVLSFIAKFIISVNSTSFTYGLQNGWMSPMTKVFKSDQSPIGRPLTDDELSWVVSMSSLSAMLTVAGFSIIVDKFGRKVTVLLITAFQTVSIVIEDMLNIVVNFFQKYKVRFSGTDIKAYYYISRDFFGHRRSNTQPSC